ncbi:MAG: YaaL family protein [Clostridiales bacterium]|nr:YaaL family protein [Clostridiales bacterium]
MSAQTYDFVAADKPKKKLRPTAKNKSEQSGEDVIILAALAQLKKDLDSIYSSLDLVTDPVLIDSYIYEMNAVNMRYKFYLRQCKDKGIVGKIF